MVTFDAARFDRLKMTLLAMCRSPDVSGYKIGFTRNPSFNRAESHRKLWGYTSFVILADCLTRDEALHVEESLFRWATRQRKRSQPASETAGDTPAKAPIVLWNKHEKQTRGGSYKRSHGGSPRELAEQPIHCVYMIWWDNKRLCPGRNVKASE